MPPSPRLIYLAGISPRSGTNWLFDLVCRHPACRAARGGEDHFLYYAHLLATYTSNLRRSWKPHWPLAESGADESILLRFGRALQAELAAGHIDHVNLSGQPAESEWSIVSKTPSTRNIHMFHRLFPEGKLVVLVRDGRAVVESAMRSFDWSFGVATNVWIRGAQQILHTQDRSEDEHSMLLVRYEDLYADPEHELRRIFEFSGLDADTYDYSDAVDAPVRGSSTYARTDEGISWKPVQKGEEFNPLMRWEDWTATRLARFDDLAGAELEALGYRRMRQPLGPLAYARHLAWRTSRVVTLYARSGSRRLYGIMRDRLT